MPARNPVIPKDCHMLLTEGTMAWVAEAHCGSARTGLQLVTEYNINVLPVFETLHRNRFHSWLPRKGRSSSQS